MILDVLKVAIPELMALSKQIFGDQVVAEEVKEVSDGFVAQADTYIDTKMDLSNYRPFVQTFIRKKLKNTVAKNIPGIVNQILNGTLG
jgi:hypothetical protein